MITSKNVPLKFNASERRVSAKAGNIKDAMDKALQSAGSGYDILIDGVVYQHSYYAVLFVIIKYTVEGTPVKSAELKAQLGESGFEEPIHQGAFRKGSPLILVLNFRQNFVAYL